VIEAAARVTGRTVPFEVHPPRAGDSPVLVADAGRARAELGWVPRHSSIETILRTALDWEMRKA
jgi:nucleoside-diphosphate-sugar epimerase